MILSRNTYFRIQRMPKPAMLASCTAYLLPSGWDGLRVAFTTRITINVDRIHPATVNSQNGMTSRRMWARPRFPHTQYLLSMKTGTDIKVTATKFDRTGFQSRMCRKANSRIWVPTTPTTEHIEERTARRPASLRACAISAAGVRLTRPDILLRRLQRTQSPGAGHGTIVRS